MTLFQGVMGLGRDARIGMIELNKARTEAGLAEARARKDRALAEMADAQGCRKAE